MEMAGMTLMVNRLPAHILSVVHSRAVASYAMNMWKATLMEVPTDQAAASSSTVAVMHMDNLLRLVIAVVQCLWEAQEIMEGIHNHQLLHPGLPLGYINLLVKTSHRLLQTPIGSLIRTLLNRHHAMLSVRWI